MGFGQYSAGGGMNRTKADLLAFATGEVISSRKGGKNRLHFTRADGSQGFILHQTIVAELSADGSRVTLADGGWHTPTTKTAWYDALAAFGLSRKMTVPGKDYGNGYCSQPYSYVAAPSYTAPTRDERSVTYTVERSGDEVRMERAADVAADLPLLRADVNDGEGGNFAVRFDAKARRIVSDAGTEVVATPFKVLVALGRIDALAKATRNYTTFRGQALWQFSFEAFGYTVHPGQSSRTIMVGCHAFRLMDVRSVARQIAAAHPEAAKKAKAFVRKHPLDYGVAAYEAQRAERVAAYRARAGRVAA